MATLSLTRFKNNIKNCVHSLHNAKDGLLVAEAIGKYFDQHIQDICLHCQDSVPSGVSIIATGGFARGHMAPHSDIDILFLVNSEQVNEQQKQFIKTFLNELWKQNFSVSHALRTCKQTIQTAKSDYKVISTLLSCRLLRGSKPLYQQLKQTLNSHLAIGSDLHTAVCQGITDNIEKRHRFYGESIYLLEPHIKEGVGGLRDYQAIRFLLQLHQKTANEMNTLEALAELEKAYAFIWATRIHMHAHSQKATERLNFSLQEHLANTLLSADGESAECSIEKARTFMNQYYSAARTIELYCRQVSRQLKSGNVKKRSFSKSFNQASFEQLLTQKQGVASRLLEMHERGQLCQVLPEFKHIDRLFQRDLYHIYTVDIHSLMLIRTLEDLYRGLYKQQYPFFTDLMQKQDLRPVLYLAGLLHDCGKGSGKAHEVVGLQYAKQAMKRFSWSSGRKKLLLFLVDQHLLLSTMAEKTDMHDPAMVSKAAKIVGSRQKLVALLLFTFADQKKCRPQHAFRLEEELVATALS